MKTSASSAGGSKDRFESQMHSGIRLAEADKQQDEVSCRRRPRLVAFLPNDAAWYHAWYYE